MIQDIKYQKYKDFFIKQYPTIAWKKNRYIWQMRRPVYCKVFIQSICKRIIQPGNKCIKNAHPAGKIPDRKNRRLEKTITGNQLRARAVFRGKLRAAPVFRNELENNLIFSKQKEAGQWKTFNTYQLIQFR
jgi:hypothetical protein